jgi:photosystem II stability/assembly factor-like uncharacterized protein
VVVPEPFVQRRRRPVALITLAAVLIVAAGAVYLRPAATVGPHTTPVTAIDPSFASKNPVDYAFVTPSIGWAAMALGGLSSNAVEFRIFRTIDGAKHWQQQLAGQSNHGLGFLPISVQFFGKTRGFMTVGQPIEQIYRTDDGGERWDPLAIPLPRVDAITFSNATSGWLVSYTGAGIPTQIAHLYSTGDSGQTWQALPDPPADAAAAAFRNPTDAWMGTVDPRLPHVYTSSDGGHSWQRHALPPLVGAFTNDRYSTRIQLLPGTGAMASIEAFRCSGGGPFPSPAVSPNPGAAALCGSIISDSFLFTSVDHGVTWRQLPSPPGTVAFQDDVHWWSVANAVFKSSDAGRSWRQVATIPTNLQFGVIGIFDSKHAWASLYVMGGYGFAVTSDGGLHWTLARVPAPA